MPVGISFFINFIFYQKSSPKLTRLGALTCARARPLLLLDTGRQNSAGKTSRYAPSMVQKPTRSVSILDSLTTGMAGTRPAPLLSLVLRINMKITSVPLPTIK